MDNPIFVKLQDIVQNAPKTPQWFGMAEQAINTIYLLGEQPDLLCTDLIKNFTTRVFSATSMSYADHEGEGEGEADTTMTPSKVPLSPAKTVSAPSPARSLAPGISPTKTVRSRAGSIGETSDRGGSFALAQLLFVVGHTAIKHIVYLELVEREFKRRKDETAKRE